MKKTARKGPARAKPKAFAKLPQMRAEEAKRRGRPVIYQDLYPAVWVDLFDAYGGVEGFVLELGLRADQHSQVRKWARDLATPGGVTRKKIRDLALHKGLQSPYLD